jgi:hypothetical protein
LSKAEESFVTRVSAVVEIRVVSDSSR